MAILLYWVNKLRLHCAFYTVWHRVGTPQMFTFFWYAADPGDCSKLQILKMFWTPPMLMERGCCVWSLGKSLQLVPTCPQTFWSSHIFHSSQSWHTCMYQPKRKSWMGHIKLSKLIKWSILSLTYSSPFNDSSQKLYFNMEWKLHFNHKFSCYIAI